MRLQGRRASLLAGIVVIVGVGVAIAVATVGLSAGHGSTALAGPPASCAPGCSSSSPGRLVLSASDVGSAYRVNSAVSGPRTLATVSAGDNPTVQSLIAKSWISGTEAAFNGRSGSVGVVSIADVFRPSSQIDDILSAWQSDATQITSGAVQKLPSNAVGTRPVLIKGKVVDYGVLLYMWRHGNAIASVEMVGEEAQLDQNKLLDLARRQEAAIERS